MPVPLLRGALSHLGRWTTYVAIGVAFNDCVIGVTFTDDKYDVSIPCI